MCTGGGQLGTAAEGPLPGTVTLWVPSVLGGVKRGVSGPRVSCGFPHWPHSKSSKLEEQEGSSATWQRDLMRGGWRRVGTGLGVDGAFSGGPVVKTPTAGWIPGWGPKIPQVSTVKCCQEI